VPSAKVQARARGSVLPAIEIRRELPTRFVIRAGGLPDPLAHRRSVLRAERVPLSWRGPVRAAIREAGNGRLMA
jgi:hypothetical protein